jgi:hypothetical protein
MSRPRAGFYAFALILSTVLAFVGVVTFLRLVQCSIEDIAYPHRIGRLCDFYVRLSPEVEPYVLVVRGSDRSPASLGGERPAPGARN